MRNNTLFDRCHVNTNIDNDDFVGIRRKKNNYEVAFPLGYSISSDEKELRKDIIGLINILSYYSERKESEIFDRLDDNNLFGIPVQAYFYVIKDFLERGYYKETEKKQCIAKRGKIDWSNTIKRIKPFIQDDEALYLDYVVKKNTINDDELITLIHKYCVYDSFDKFGWLFSAFMPPKVVLKLSKTMMLSVVCSRLNNTFNDRNRQLFQNMIAIIKSMHENENVDFRYGTHKGE